MMTTSEVIAKGIKTAWMLQENYLIHTFQLLQSCQQFHHALAESAASIFLKPLDMSVITDLVPPVWCGKAPK